MAMIYGTEEASGRKISQVYQATHRGDGSRLPLMNRSFISFSYGGKHIEDFDLIATINGDRLSRNGYAPFEDNTTTYSNLDGQYYWGTHFQANELELTLSTDGIDQKKLDDFLYWFRAGETKELILAEHPNRAILARVAEQPQLNLLPFEGPINITISNVSYQTSTTLYKGDISLRFIMDEPHWYALENILGLKEENANHVQVYVDKWWDYTTTPPSKVSIFASKDALKILYEDGIPLGSMFDENMLLGNGAYAQVKDNYTSLIWPDGTPEYIDWANYSSTVYACTAKANGDVIGTIAGAILDATGNGISTLPSGEQSAGYFYYSGNAPAYTVIKFTMTITFNNSNYVTSPYNSQTEYLYHTYNTLTVESEHKQELKFTTPNYLTSYNKANEILRTGIDNDSSAEDVRATLRDNVHHIYARSWAIHVVDMFTSNGNWNGSATADKLSAEMAKFLFPILKNNGDIDKDILPTLTVTFNSQTGEAVGEMKYRDAATGNLITAEENVGDMLRSNHIVIKDRNYPTENGRIVAWDSNHKQYSHRIYHDMQTAITNVSIIYKNMYL